MTFFACSVKKQLWMEACLVLLRILFTWAHYNYMLRLVDSIDRHLFSFPEAAIVLVSTKNSDLWAGPIRRPWFSDFPSNLTNLIGWEYETNAVCMLRKSGRCWPKGSWPLGMKECIVIQCSNKVPTLCPGQVDFHSGQVSFHSHLPNGRGIRQVVCQLKRAWELPFFSSPGHQCHQHLRAEGPLGCSMFLNQWIEVFCVYGMIYLLICCHFIFAQDLLSAEVRGKQRFFPSSSREKYGLAFYRFL